MALIRTLPAAEAREHLDALADVLLDCVAGGASVGFMASFSKAEALAFFETVVDAVERGQRILLAAFSGPALVGTVQVVIALPPNQPHRAELAKLLVRRSARGQGIGEQLVTGAEAAAKSAGKSLLVLDTVTGDAGERLYLRLGWTKAGVIPRYALYPDGSWCATSIFFKLLAREDS